MKYILRHKVGGRPHEYRQHLKIAQEQTRTWYPIKREIQESTFLRYKKGKREISKMPA
jgi:hypothetical protein